MYPYEAEAISRAIIADRLQEAAHQRLVREARQPEKDNTIGAATATASANRRSRLWKLVHLSHAYG